MQLWKLTDKGIKLTNYFSSVSTILVKISGELISAQTETTFTDNSRRPMTAVRLLNFRDRKVVLRKGLHA